MEFNLEELVRRNIKEMKAYSSARHEFSGIARVFLDANENAAGSPLRVNYNRYPDPLQTMVKEKISSIKGLPVQNIFTGNGSDEAIDLLFRVFCEPGKDNVLLFPPTYGMYEVCAGMNDIKIKKVLLQENFQLDLPAIEEAIDADTKLIFICSPNNPTGNSINREDIEIVLNNFDGLVIIDEAYINYARQRSFIPGLAEYPNLVILQTLSKAWGLAGLRLGMAFASASIISYLDKIKYPYNINTATQQLVLEALENTEQINTWIQATVEQRAWLLNKLQQLPFVEHIYPSDANFILVRVDKVKQVHEYLSGNGIIVRDRSGEVNCTGCLRITIGTPEENQQLVDTLKTFNV